jgi:protein-disulfide isomerase
LFVLGAMLLSGGSGSPEALPGVDLSGLSDAQKAVVTKVMTARECGCTCGMKVAECRMKDPSCSYSQGVASVMVAALKSGKTEAEAIAAADASQWAHLPVQDNRILSDAVKIPTDGSPVIGPADAKIKLVEFSDFQCPFCILAKPEIDALLKAYPNQISLTFKQFPLDEHSQAALAAVAALAAQKQGKFWPMHDGLFAQQGNLSPKVVLAVAGKIGLSLMQFEADLKSEELRKAVERDRQDGEKAGVMGTPTIFVNGQRYNGPVKLSVLKGVIESELKAPGTSSNPSTKKS